MMDAGLHWALGCKAGLCLSPAWRAGRSWVSFLQIEPVFLNRSGFILYKRLIGFSIN